MYLLKHYNVGIEIDKILVAKRTSTNRRYYTYDQYLEYKGFDGENNNSRKIILYARFSTNNQKDYLKNQILFLQNFVNAKGVIVDEVVEDIGSGLIIIVKNGIKELVQDIVSILHIFSCRIYGMRKYKKKIEEDREVAKSIQNGNKTNISTEG